MLKSKRNETIERKKEVAVGWVCVYLQLVFFHKKQSNMVKELSHLYHQVNRAHRQFHFFFYATYYILFRLPYYFIAVYNIARIKSSALKTIIYNNIFHSIASIHSMCTFGSYARVLGYTCCVHANVFVYEYVHRWH